MHPTWRAHLDRYRTPSDARGAFEVFVTVAGLLGCWPLMLWSLERAPALLVAPFLLYSGLLIRLFVLQHDAGHGGLFRTPRLNDVVGMLICIPIFTPYYEWQKSHALHHKGTGHLGRRNPGDVYTMTLDEWRDASVWQRAAYRVMRHPVTLLVVAPLYVFLLLQRVKGSLCKGLPRGKNLVNVHLTTLGGVALVALGAHVVGAGRFFALHGLALWLAGAVGVWFFYVHHQYERTYWRDGQAWDYGEAGLHGASLCDLPRPLHWLTANIGYHHVHHLDPRVPFYRLPACHEDTTLFDSVTRVSILDGCRAFRLKLWDGERLISFAEASRRLDAAQAPSQPIPTT